MTWEFPREQAGPQGDAEGGGLFSAIGMSGHPQPAASSVPPRLSRLGSEGREREYESDFGRTSQSKCQSRNSASHCSISLCGGIWHVEGRRVPALLSLGRTLNTEHQRVKCPRGHLASDPLASQMQPREDGDSLEAIQ